MSQLLESSIPCFPGQYTRCLHLISSTFVIGRVTVHIFVSTFWSNYISCHLYSSRLKAPCRWMRDSPLCLLCHSLVCSLQLADLHQSPQLDCRTYKQKVFICFFFLIPRLTTWKDTYWVKKLVFNNPPTLYEYKLGRRETCVLVNALCMRKVDYVTQVNT